MKLLIASILLFAWSISFSQEKPELLLKLKNTPRDTTAVRLYGKISKIYINTQPDSATFYIGEGLKLAKELKDTKGEGMMLSQLGIVNEVHGNLVLAEKYALQALAIFKQLNDTYSIAICENGIGVIEAKKGNFTKGANHFFTALELFKKLKDNYGIVQTYIKLGTVSDASGNLEKSLEYANLAWELNHDDTTNNAYYTLCNNIGINYGRRGNFKKAIEYFEKGIKTSNTERFIDVHISLLNNAMKGYAEMGNKQKALEYYQLALKSARDYEIPEEEARTLVNFADIHTDNPALAETYLKQALELSLKVGRTEMTADIYSALTDVYEKQQKYKEAMGAVREHNKLRDSLYSLNKTRELASLFASYELNESKSKIQELELVNQERTFERNLVIIGIAAVSIILLLLWFYYRKMNVLNRKLNESNKIKDKLFSIIGHDLKAPVGGLVQTLELLEDDDLNAEERKYVIGQLRKQTQLSLDTLNALLNWGEAQLKGVSVNAQHFETKGIISKNVDLLSKQAAEKSIFITDNTAETITVLADVNHFDVVVRNLLSNAVKFTKEHGAIEINAMETAKDGMVVFSVKDNGQGISEEQQQQFLSSNINVSFGTKGEKGTGLGLLLTKEFILANGGKIWLESKVGEGTTFYFSLRKG
jgi:signal transduction histidine kinase